MITENDSSFKKFTISSKDAGLRLDRFLKERLHRFSRRTIQEWIREGRVQFNGKTAQKGVILQGGDQVVLGVRLTTQNDSILPDASFPLQILFEDTFLVAVAKPSGLSTYPLQNGEKGTVANALAAQYPEMQGIGFSIREPGLLHRLDKETSGVLLAARSAFSFEQLRIQFEQERVVKIYKAVVQGRPASRGMIDKPIGSRTRRSNRVEVVGGQEPAHGVRGLRPAETRYRVIRSGERYSLVHLRMTTGARHQLRAHLSFLGHPVAGDRLYGSGSSGPPGETKPTRHLLHAAEIRFFHPEQGRTVRIRCPLPGDFQDFLNAHGLV